jgi:hypothetical protein
MPVRLPGRCNYDSRPQNPQEGGWVGVEVWILAAAVRLLGGGWVVSSRA